MNLPPVVTNNCELGYKMHRNINAIIDKNDLEYARGNTPYTYLCRIIALKKIL